MTGETYKTIGVNGKKVNCINEPDFITAAQEVVDNLAQSDLRSYIEGFCKFLIENPDTETAKSFSDWWEEGYSFIHNVDKYGQDIQSFVKDFIADEDVDLYKTYIDEAWAEQF